MRNVINFKKKGNNPGYLYFYSDEGDFMLCEDGLHDWFDFPDNIVEFDIIVQDKPFMHCIDIMTGGHELPQLIQLNGFEQSSPLLCSCDEYLESLNLPHVYVGLEY